MTLAPSQDELIKSVARWLPAYQVPARVRVYTDTTDFFRIDYNDVVVLDGKSYLIRHNAKEQRFGLEDEPKHWVKYAVSLEDGARKIIKLVFYERFTATVGDVKFERFRSPKKEARILELVRGHPNFMQGFAVPDEKGNIVRVLDVIEGETLSSHVRNIDAGHEDYFHGLFPSILESFMECIEAVRFLHEHGEKHGDIRRDHVLMDSATGRYRWIDFDYNYRHRENIYGFDLFGIGNILAFIAGKGDILIQDLRKTDHPALGALSADDMNIIFNNRVVNLRKVYPYIPEGLNRILMHFSAGAKWFYEDTSQLIEDLKGFISSQTSQ